MKKIKIILPVKDIPDGAIVHKKGGSYLYKLHSEVRVYPKTFTAIGCKYIFNIKETNSITTVSEDTEFVWVTTPEQLHKYLGEYLKTNKEI